MTDRPGTEIVAALMVRGYNRHIKDHGPDGSYAGEAHQSRDGHAVLVERDGSQFSVYVERLPAATADAPKTPGQCWAALRDEIQELRSVYYDHASDLADEGKPDERAYGRVDALDDVLLRMARMGDGS